MLGKMHYEGNGFDKDISKAAYYFKLAASKGNSESNFMLGIINLEDDNKLAREYFELSSVHQNSKASLELGKLYEKDTDIQHDYIKAKNYYILSIIQGNSLALLN